MRATTLTIKRPDGEIESVDISQHHPSGLTDQMFETIKAATAKAGRGECLSYSVVEAPLSAEAKAEVDRENAFGRWLDRNDETTR